MRGYQSFARSPAVFRPNKDGWRNRDQTERRKRLHTGVLRKSVAQTSLRLPLADGIDDSLKKERSRGLFRRPLFSRRVNWISQMGDGRGSHDGMSRRCRSAGFSELLKGERFAGDPMPMHTVNRRGAQPAEPIGSKMFEHEAVFRVARHRDQVASHGLADRDGIIPRSGEIDPLISMAVLGKDDALAAAVIGNGKRVWSDFPKEVVATTHQIVELAFFLRGFALRDGAPQQVERLLCSSKARRDFRALR